MKTESSAVAWLADEASCASNCNWLSEIKTDQACGAILCLMQGTISRTHLTPVCLEDKGAQKDRYAWLDAIKLG